MNKQILLSLAGISAACIPVTGPAAQAAQRSDFAPRLFDSGWQFHRGDAPGAEAPTYRAAGWRRVDLPHDYSIEDLPEASAPTAPTLAITPGLWKFKLGDDASWKLPSTPDSDWQSVQLPAGWRSHVTGPMNNAFGWYRRRFDVPVAMKGKDIILNIGKADDADETFVNGVKVGGLGQFPPSYTTAWTVARRYRVPAKLLKGDGTDVAAVRVYNGDGDGGIYESAAPPRISGPFDSEAVSGAAQGFTTGDVAWYRKEFVVHKADQGKHVAVEFEGVYMNATFWLNGKPLGTHPYGYTSFWLDLTPNVRFGAKNVLSVRVDSSGQTSRWYSGSGIYRHVWLSTQQPVHIAPWGVSITTPEVSESAAGVHIKTTVRNDSATASNVSVESDIVDPGGKVVVHAVAAGQSAAASARDFEADAKVDRPLLWSPEKPSLYHLVTTVKSGGTVVDETREELGIRSIKLDAEHGFILNGKPLKLRGGCVHHDDGILGSAAFDRAEERRVTKLKAAGFNAIRTSHNPPSPAFLAACDRLGMLVMDEAFDCWKYGKNGQDYHLYFDAWWRKDIESMVLRDRNHPSVVMWSIGNEIPEQTGPEAADRGGMLADAVRHLDPTRPVTQATNPDADKLDPLLEHLDVTGYNYAFWRFPDDHKKHPARVFQQTESYPTACFDSWMMAEDHPYVIGDFVWTALDYLGEAGIGRAHYPGEGSGFLGDFPYAVSGCGDLDLIGDRKPQSYYRGVVWNVGPKVAAFVDAVAEGEPKYQVSGWGWPDERASWTWPGTEGKIRTVRVYANTSSVRLWLNGRDLGVREVNRATHDTATYTVPYEPGQLIAVGLDSAGHEVSRWNLETTGKPAALRLTPESKTVAAGGQDIAYFAVDVLDDRGRLVSDAAPLINFSVSGPGKIVAVGTGDPRTDESFQKPRHKAYRGRCMVVIRSTDKSGMITVKANSNGLTSAQARVESR